MKQRTRVIAAAIVLGLAAAAAATRPYWSPPGAVAQAPPAARVIPVEVAKAVKKPAPVILEALGTVTPIQSVAVRTRLDSEIVGVHFDDGASARQAALLFTLYTRPFDAQLNAAPQPAARAHGAARRRDSGPSRGPRAGAHEYRQQRRWAPRHGRDGRHHGQSRSGSRAGRARRPQADVARGGSDRGARRGDSDG